jgi:hypothetical protein
MASRRLIINTGPAVGLDGAATSLGRSDAAAEGVIRAVHVDFTVALAAATCDLVLRTAGQNGPSLPLLTLVDTATDGWFYPKQLEHDESGGALATRAFVPVSDQLEVEIDEVDADDFAVVTILYADR